MKSWPLVKERETHKHWSRLRVAQATPPQQLLRKLTSLPRLIITPMSHKGDFAEAGLRRTAEVCESNAARRHEEQVEMTKRKIWMQRPSFIKRILAKQA